jgi:inosine-uridine nucleoside N-ribohydrolase
MHKTFLFGCLLLFLIFVTPAAAQTPRPVIIDTDMTSDDWMATLYLLNNPDFSVKAITVTGTGWAFCDAGVRAALGLVALANYGDIPVSCWRDNPLLGGDNPVNPDYRTSMDSLKSLGLPEGGQPSDMNAVELFTSTVQASPDKVTVLAIGPLTNLAQAFNTTPALIDKIDMVYVMGGAVDVPGSAVSDTNTSAEWNIYCDPPAARMVFESGVPITLIALDASNDLPITMDFLSKLEADQTTPEAKFMAMVLKNSTGFIQSGGYYFWDPLAAAVLADPSLVTLTQRDVTVIDIPGADYGRTQPVGNGPRIMVATKPNGDVFEQRLLDTWNS